MAGYLDVGCLPGCSADHSRDAEQELVICRTTTGAVTVNDLAPYPEPLAVSVGVVRALGPPEDAAFDEGPRVVVWRSGDADVDVLTPSAARSLGWALIAAADMVDRRS